MRPVRASPSLVAAHTGSRAPWGSARGRGTRSTGEEAGARAGHQLDPERRTGS
ncbi:hypothetical protein [Streptomyces phage phiScoe2]|nr:hypothetical protein [Streptomyces phage phiScoe2]